MSGQDLPSLSETLHLQLDAHLGNAAAILERLVQADTHNQRRKVAADESEASRQARSIILKEWCAERERVIATDCSQDKLEEISARDHVALAVNDAKSKTLRAIDDEPRETGENYVLLKKALAKASAHANRIKDDLNPVTFLQLQPVGKANGVHCDQIKSQPSELKRFVALALARHDVRLAVSIVNHLLSLMTSDRQGISINDFAAAFVKDDIAKIRSKCERVVQANRRFVNGGMSYQELLTFLKG